tara:strand:+ start:273 stop:581 length:309 start_codon:yes stop_codon:yes gene_type:complete
MDTLRESFSTLQGKRDYYIVESYVDEIDECLVMRCSTIEGASHIADMLAIAIPDMTFDIKDVQPMIHLRDYDPDKYARVKEYILGGNDPPRPKLILIQGGKE